jgi:hypothetical protein
MSQFKPIILFSIKSYEYNNLSTILISFFHHNAKRYMYLPNKFIGIMSS